MSLEPEPHDPLPDCDCRACAIWERNKLREIVGALRYPLHADDRAAAQAEGKHPRPCAKFCEANAFEIEERMLRARIRDQQRAIAELKAALGKAEAFISGFEGDEAQEGIAELLAVARAALSPVEART